MIDGFRIYLAGIVVLAIFFLAGKIDRKCHGLTWGRNPAAWAILPLWPLVAIGALVLLTFTLSNDD